MQSTIFFLLFLATCGFAQEESLPDSADNILPAADVKKLPFAEENPVAKPVDDDRNCANVEDLQRELSEERAKNRDLNQTISDILERMADMEMNIIRNEEKITQAQSSVVLLTKDVEDLTDEVDGVQVDVAAVQGDVAAVQGDVAVVQADVASNQGDIAVIQGDVSAVQDDVVVVAGDVERNSADITTLATFGTWCGEQYRWATVGTITYDSITFSASNNMNIGATPLDINTGIFTVPVSGAWRVTYSMYSTVDSGDLNFCYLYRNGERLDETSHTTNSESGTVRSTGGRVVTLEASAGDKIEIRTETMRGSYYDILYCAEYIPKM